MAADIIIAALAVFFVGLMVYKTVKRRKKAVNPAAGAVSGAAVNKRG